MKSHHIINIINLWKYKGPYAGHASSFYIIEPAYYAYIGMGETLYFDTLEQLVEKYCIYAECDVKLEDVEKLLCLL